MLLFLIINDLKRLSITHQKSTLQFKIWNLNHSPQAFLVGLFCYSDRRFWLTQAVSTIARRGLR